MQDLEFPLLTPRIVSGLTGISPKTLRRWEAQRVLPPARRRSTRKPASGTRLYSWREVEQLQQATYLVKTKRLPLAEVKRFLKQSAAASIDRDWVIARPKPRTRRTRLSG
jgi:DNA-binding transcriptional MerR regulator